MNKLLNKKEFENYQSALNLLNTHVPEMMSRKIPEASIQQAFTLQTAIDLTPKNGMILSAGSWEDTATATLKKLDYNVVDVDPVVNTDLKTWFDKNQNAIRTFDSVVSTSVIEHVSNDEEFLDCICKLLKFGGYGILTMDYNNDYLSGTVTKPNEDVRLYTEYDLNTRLNKILISNNCELLEYNYEGENDFCYNGHWYTFATFVFKKI